MKSKIVKQFGAMLLAGTMIVTSGNVTTYAAEQTDESQEVDVNTESETGQEELYAEPHDYEDLMIENEDFQNELYSSPRKKLTKLYEGDGFYICKEQVGDSEKNVAYVITDNTGRNIEDIIREVVENEYMKENAVIALATSYENIDISKNVIKLIKENEMGLMIVTGYYNRLYYYELYFKKISNEGNNLGFKIEYNKDSKLINKLSNESIDCFSYTIEDLENKKTFDKNMVGNGIISQRILLEHNDLYNKNLSKDNIKQYYYDTEIGKFVLINKNFDIKCTMVSNSSGYTSSLITMKEQKAPYYGTYLICNNPLPSSIVFDTTGLCKVNDKLIYYTNGLRDTSYTGLCDYDGMTYYVKDGSVDYNANMLYEYNGSTWNIKNGKVDTTESMTMNNGSLVYTNGGKTNNETTLCKYNGEWYYIHNGKVDYSATTLYKYNGSWWYIENGKVNFNKNGLCKYNGSWWYISGGKVNFNATGLCKYNGSWWYVSGGRVNFNATGLCKYNGSWWYVSGGKVNFNATGLCKYNGSWWYVSGGKVNFNATGLCKYNGSWWYVSSGRVNFNATGLCKYNGYWFYVENGAVRFKNTLCKYNGTWWYINNGVVNFNKTTLCKYGKNWFAVSKGKVAWNYTGYINYNGERYKVINGVVKF